MRLINYGKRQYPRASDAPRQSMILLNGVQARMKAQSELVQALASTSCANISPSQDARIQANSTPALGCLQFIHDAATSRVRVPNRVLCVAQLVDCIRAPLFQHVHSESQLLLLLLKATSLVSGAMSKANALARIAIYHLILCPQYTAHSARSRIFFKLLGRWVLGYVQMYPLHWYVRLLER